MDAIPCFAFSLGLNIRPLESKQRPRYSRFIPSHLYRGTCVKHSRQWSIVKASASENDQSEEYKRFSDLLGPPEGRFVEKKQVQGISNPADEEDEEDIAAKRANDYEKMADVLGPPKGRFQRNTENAKSRQTKVSKKLATKGGTDKAAYETEEQQSLSGNSQSEQSKNFSESPATPEEKLEESEDKLAAKRAVEYAAMADLLGPPQGRFGRNGENTTSKKPNSHRQVESASESSAATDEAKRNELNEQTLPPPKREAKTMKEEYQLFESMLRGGKGSKPRKGGKRYVTEEMLVDGIVTDPWNVDFNLMPKKTPGMAKRAPPKKGEAPQVMPDRAVLTNEDIEQSYWALEQLLEDEELEYQAVKEEEKLAAQKKREEKRKAKLLRKPAHPDDAISQKVSAHSNDKSETKDDLLSAQIVEKPSSVLQQPPKRRLEANVSTTAGTVEIESPGKDQEVEEVRPLLQKPPQRSVGEVEDTVVAKTEEAPTPAFNGKQKTIPQKRRTTGLSVLVLKNPMLVHDLGEELVDQ